MERKINNPYERFSPSDLILRDELAIDRTILANERTLLTYIRTALAFAVTGAAIIKFFGGAMLAVFGSGSIALAIAIAVLGVIRYRQISRRIQVSRRAPAAAPPGRDAPN